MLRVIFKADQSPPRHIWEIFLPSPERLEAHLYETIEVQPSSMQLRLFPYAEEGYMIESAFPSFAVTACIWTNCRKEASPWKLGTSRIVHMSDRGAQ